MKLRLPNLKSKQGNILVALIAIIAIFGIMIAFFGAGILFSLGYSGGWEVRTELNSVQVSGRWYTQITAPVGNIPWGPKTVKFDPTDRALYPNTWDFVQEPDIHISIDDPIHTKEDSVGNLIVNRNGDVISCPLDEPNNQFSKVIDAETFFYYEHIYAYLVTVRTQGDQQDLGLLWQSNTEMKGEEGIALDYTVRSMFTVAPWNIVGQTYTDEDGNDFKVTQSWAGVMSASAEVVTSGFTEPSINAMSAIDKVAKNPTGWEILSLPQAHSSLNMFTVDGKPVQNSDIDTYGAVRDVPNSVLIDVSGHLWNGGEQPLFALCSTHDVYASVLVKVSVLTHAAYAPITGTDPIADPPIDDRSGPQPFWFPLAYTLGKLWGDWWWMVALVIGIVAIVLILIAATYLRRLFG